jgi:hypothetical protein
VTVLDADGKGEAERVAIRHWSLDVALKFSGEIGRRPDGVIDAGRSMTPHERNEHDVHVLAVPDRPGTAATRLRECHEIC